MWNGNFGESMAMSVKPAEKVPGMPTVVVDRDCGQTPLVTQVSGKVIDQV